jgi:hypothetical protein
LPLSPCLRCPERRAMEPHTGAATDVP